MPIYKNKPHDKKTTALPFYRPIDRLLLTTWEKKRLLVPYALVLLVLVMIYFALQYYTSLYNDKASRLLESGQLADVVQRYGRSEAALLARMKLAATALQEGRLEESLKLYGETVEHAERYPMLRIAALHNEALVYVKKGNFEEALKLMDRAVKDPQNAIPDYSRLLIGRTYELNGDLEKAKETYKGLSEAGVKPSIQGEAKERLSWIESPKEK